LNAPVTTRFAPSPTGFLHLGHAYAAILAHDLARARGGRFLLRVEDIDRGRCRTEFEHAVYEDLEWLGLSWDGAVIRQSDRLDRYRAALESLAAQGLLYPCFCTRAEIAAEVARMPAAPHELSGPPYPGTCRALARAERTARMETGEAFAWRLDVAAAIARLGGSELYFRETGAGPAGESGEIPVTPALAGDIVLGRKDFGVSYHVACVVDDAGQGVTLVSRGNDLFAATHIQRLLQALLGLPAPAYHHHRLVCDPAGRRLAKRDRDQTLRALRGAGVTPVGVRVRLGLPPA
jgi:glutamyl-Q tRNA(Asp) synthetase